MSINLDALKSAEILVAGDVMLDRYIWGDVSRISPEAPVPVVRVNNKTEVLGGAGNVASNLSGLRCRVSIIGACGNDETGTSLKAIMDRNGIENFLHCDPSRPTISKTRIMAGTQQMLRLDEEECMPLSPGLAKQILESFEKILKRIHIVILSDYAKGFFQTPGLCEKMIELCKKQNIPVLVDPKGDNWERYNGATCITPNTSEFKQITGVSAGADEEDLVKTMAEARSRYNLDSLLLTRGPEGMSLVTRNDAPCLIPTRAKEVFDVSGAGDTVIATLAAGLAAGLTLRQAAELANTAAGVVVGKIGTQPVSRTELELAIQATDQSLPGYLKIAPVPTAASFTKSWRTNGETVVFTNGCFDLLHPGHVDLLHKASGLGNRLIVGLNSDSSVKRLKGETRPILTEQDRAAILSALGCVDLVVIFEEDTPLELITALKPDIIVKGADYKPEDVVGKDVVESYGGRVCLVPLMEGHSTTGIANRISLSNKNA